MMEIINLSLQILPLVPEARLYDTVDKVIQFIKDSGVKYTVGPMETTMEGPMDKLFVIALEAHYICARQGAERVAAVIKTDFRPGGVSIDEKIAKYR